MEQIQSATKLIEKEGVTFDVMNHLGTDKIKQLLLMFFLSAALFAYEVLLTRYFSTVINVNLVYLVVSSALFGTGLGAYHAHSSLKDKDQAYISKFISKNMYLLAISIILFWGLALVGPYMKGYTFYIMGSSSTFIFGGMVMSAIYLKQSEFGHEFYFVDMLGAVFGCVIIVVGMMLFEFYSGIAVMFFLMALALVSNSNSMNKTFNYISVIVLIFSGALLFTEPVIDFMNNHFDAYYHNPNKGVAYISEAHKSDVEIIYSKWSAFSRTDVLKLTNDDDVRYILTDGGASAPIVKFDGNLQNLEDMKTDVTFLSYLIGNNDKSLLIGSGGGKDVIYALLSGSKNITAVEINEGTIDAVNASKEYSGDIYNQPGVSLIVGDGRKFVDETTETFDHIYLSMLMSNAIDNSRLSLVENYIFTKEAFSSYMKALNPDGRISFMVHNGVEAVRVANTWIETLIESGVPEREVNNYFVIVDGMKNHDSQPGEAHMPSVILKKKPFTEEELLIINNYLIDEEVAAMHLPFKPNQLYSRLNDGSASFKDIISQLDINVAPVKDTNPFFYKYSKGFPNEILPLMIPTLIIGVFLLSKANRIRGSIYYSANFLIIGMGYMIVELGFIQSLQRYLEKPIFSFTLVLIGLLTGSAFGALVSGKIPWFEKFKIYSGLVIGVVIISSYFWLNKITLNTMALSIPEKLSIVLPIILIVGFFMGIPFPYSIERMSKDKYIKGQIPLMYALNGYAAVIGSMLALIIAMNFGFVFVVLVGAMLYFVLGVMQMSDFRAH